MIRQFFEWMLGFFFGRGTEIVSRYEGERRRSQFEARQVAARQAGIQQALKAVTDSLSIVEGAPSMDEISTAVERLCVRKGTELNQAEADLAAAEARVAEVRADLHSASRLERILGGHLPD